jgi:dipeptidase D
MRIDSRVVSAVASVLLWIAAPAGAAPPAPGPDAIAAARHAVKTYPEALVKTLGTLVSFNTVADKDIAFERNGAHLGFKQALKDEAARLGLDYVDHGYVVVIGLGTSDQRVGMVTHGDVQPVDPSKWKQSPFTLDTRSEPGRLVGRGTEDDKGPIATALYAMKAIKDRKLALSKRLELYVYMAEESDWAPLEQFLKTHVAPQLSITLDAEYPVVTAEKGYGAVVVTVPALALPAGATGPSLSAFAGGFFASQIPEDASAVIEQATPALEAAFRQRVASQPGMRYRYAWQGQQLRITALGVSAHSSKPEDGRNAISLLADGLSVQAWPNNTPGALVNFLNDLIGTGIHGEKFGSIAYQDDFMGPMTFAPTVIKQEGGAISLNINLRRPRGKTAAQLESELREALAAWQARRVSLADIKIRIGNPWERHDAPQVPTLLSVFSHYTGVRNPQPVSIGGGTNSRLFPNAVSFGPAMPGQVYSGHSEHEFITRKQLLLNLQMYTAVLVELAR